MRFYIDQHNTNLARAAFQGQTPDEMYLGTGGEIPQQLAAAEVVARKGRLAANRAVRCSSYRKPVAVSP